MDTFSLYNVFFSVLWIDFLNTLHVYSDLAIWMYNDAGANQYDLPCMLLEKLQECSAFDVDLWHIGQHQKQSIIVIF